MNFLHEQKGIAHLDIKLENVVIDSHYMVKLIDLAFCENKQNLMCAAKGTERYFAPEVAEIFYRSQIWNPEYLIEKATYVAEKADIFSMGILLFTLMFGQPPFNQNTPHFSPLLPYLCNTSAHYQEEYFMYSELTSRLNAKGLISPGFKALLRKMLAFDPNDRMSLSEIMRTDEWINSNHMDILTYH